MEARHVVAVRPTSSVESDTNDRSILLIYYVFSLGNNTIWNCMSFIY
jgi:hypothetical protein